MDNIKYLEMRENKNQDKTWSFPLLEMLNRRRDIMNRWRHWDRQYFTNFNSTAEVIPEHQQTEQPPDDPPDNLVNGRTVVILSDESQWPLTISCFLKLVSGPVPSKFNGWNWNACLYCCQTSWVELWWWWMSIRQLLSACLSTTPGMSCITPLS